MMIKKISNKNEIQTIMIKCKDSFYSEKAKNIYFIEALSEKFFSNAEFYVALDEDEVFGFIAFYCNNIKEKTAFISMIIVNSISQGKGVGTLLLKKVISICNEKSFKTIRLEVDNNNKRAIGFYEKKGFKKIKSNENSSFYEFEL